VAAATRNGLTLAAAALVAACGSGDGKPAQDAAGTQAKVLNVYNWADYIGKSTIADFEAQSGIKVIYDTYDSNEVLETKLLTGNTGYDVVVPSGNFLERQIKTGAFLKLDKSKLPNLANMDPEITRFVADHDPGNQYGIDYMWGTTGIGYNPDLVEKALGTRRIDSWSALFDPKFASKLASCGISMLDAPEDVFEAARIYLGRDPNSEREEDLAAAEKLLDAVRPYVRYFHSSQHVNDLASGEICVSLSWSGLILQARDRGAAASRPDAPHPENAYAFIDYLMDPPVIAKVSNEIGYANGNASATPLLDSALRSDPGVYPGKDVLKTLHRSRLKSQEFSRLQNRAWTRIKSGQ